MGLESVGGMWCDLNFRSPRSQSSGGGGGSTQPLHRGQRLEEEMDTLTIP